MREPGAVTLADGKTLQVQGRGTIEVPIQGKDTQITGVIHVPKIGFNLLSISQLAERGMTCDFTADTATLSRGGAVVAIAARKGRAYALAGAAESATYAAHAAHADCVAQSITQAEVWHQRLGHLGEQKTRLIEKAAYEGAPKALEHVADCETCYSTKSTQATSKVPASKAKEPLGRVHIDFWGPYHEATIAGRRYMLTITDDHTRKSWIRVTTDRIEVYTIFQQWQAAIELESGYQLKAVRIDNAPELVKLGEELEGSGMRIERTAAYTPSQNGVAERLNRTLITKARALLAGAELPDRLWGEAVHVANYLRNLTPLEDGVSPEQRWTGQKPKIGHLRVFGCVVYTHILAQKR
jgi:transposase InsO family protein